MYAECVSISTVQKQLVDLSVNVSPPETDVMFFKKLGDNIFWQFLQKDNHKIGF
jgi:hypothetical protein